MSDVAINPATTDEDRAAALKPGRGRDASNPIQIPPKGWVSIGKRVFASLGQDRVMLVAGGVTYYTLLALVPALTAFVAIYGIFADRATVIDHVALMSGVIPGGGLELITEQLERIITESSSTLSWTLFVSLAIALWSASAGVKALFEAMNIAYGEEEKRNFLKLNALGLAFTLLAAVAAALSLAVVIILPAVVGFLPLGPLAEWSIRILSYVILGVVMVLGLAALYRFGPSRQAARWRWITPGAIFAIVLMLAVSIAFTFYVSNFGNYNATYGSLGALIGFLTWLWISFTLMILGAELNAEIEHQTARDSTTGPEKPLGERGAVMADTVGVD